MRLAIALLLVLVACDPPRRPQATQRSSNVDYAVEFLFEHESCRVFRFYDNGSYRYWVTCPSGARTESTTPCGKSCIHRDTVETGTRP